MPERLVSDCKHNLPLQEQQSDVLAKISVLFIKCLLKTQTDNKIQSGIIVDHPRTKSVFVPHQIDNFNISLDGDGCQIQHRSVQANP